MRRKGISVQELMGIKSFSKYGIKTIKGEMIFYEVAPTNISVLSHSSIEQKIRHFMMVLSSIPDIEVLCTDSSECFDNNKMYLKKRFEEENNEAVQKLLKKDLIYLDQMQNEMSTARKFIFVIRYKNLTEEQLFNLTNRVEKVIEGQNFEIQRLDKGEIKRVLSIYFYASVQGETIPDIDGIQFFNETKGSEVDK